MNGAARYWSDTFTWNIGPNFRNAVRIPAYLGRTLGQTKAAGREIEPISRGKPQVYSAPYWACFAHRILKIMRLVYAVDVCNRPGLNKVGATKHVCN